VNLPNTITLGRIFLVPLLVVVLLTNPKEFLVFGVSKEIAGALIFAVASITDWLDGYLARRRGQITGLGQWMDPLADKLLVIASLISLVYLDLAKAWMVAVIIGREFYVTVIRSMAHARGQSLPASPLGKIKLIAQVAAILILLLSHGRLQGLFFVGMVALWIATIAAILSAIDYTRKINVLMATKMTEAPALNQNAGPVETTAGKPQAVAKPTAAAGEGRKRISA
jgi:CDP-diacylglycerol---glycerol-3-phosphate 3-phosphatidyltransferase